MTPRVQVVDGHQTDDLLGMGALDGTVIMPRPPLPSHQKHLFDIGHNLLNQGQYSISIVVFHMACEVAVARALDRAYAAKGLQDLQPAIDEFMNGYNLANHRNRDLYNSLLGVEIDKQPFWSAFCESAFRRNKIIHRGLIVTQADAHASYQACHDFLTHVGI